MIHPVIAYHLLAAESFDGDAFHRGLVRAIFFLLRVLLGRRLAGGAKAAPVKASSMLLFISITLRM